MHVACCVLQREFYFHGQKQCLLRKMTVVMQQLRPVVAIVYVDHSMENLIFIFCEILLLDF